MSTLLGKLNKVGPKRILSLDGGGIKGVLTIGLLENLESVLRIQHQNPKLLLCDYFDLIGGTSTGSIIASCLSIGMSVSELKEHYFSLGKVIFGKKKSILNFITKGEKYDVTPLNSALQHVLGDILLGDLEKIKTGLCIIAKRADTFSTWPFINHPSGKFYNDNKDIPLWKVVRASSAAPTYFLPITLKIGENEFGTFIDGGISMANNPSFNLFMVSSLSGFPFHWKIGREELIIVSLGTGSVDIKANYADLKQQSLMSWASAIPNYFLKDANHYNQMIMQILSDSPTSKVIDSEMGDLKKDTLHGKYALSYLRYDAEFSKDYLNEIGLNYSDKIINALPQMDNTSHIKELYEIGKLAGQKQILNEHFPECFKLDYAPKTADLKQYTMDKISDLNFEYFHKKPLKVGAIQINEAFEVKTMEGIMKGKSGDFLMQGVNGEMYVCDQEIFYKTYQKLPTDGVN